MMASTKKSPAVFIGVHPVLVAALSAQHSDTISASAAPFLGKREGTDEEWREACRVKFEESDAEEQNVIAHAMTALGKELTVYAVSASFGARDDKGKVTAYPTVASAEAWRQFGSLAKAVGATIRYL